MKDTAKRVAASRLAYGPLRAFALPGAPVTALVYHTLGPDSEDFDAWTVLPIGEFRRQIDFLREHYDIVSLDDALVALPAQGHARPRVVITFDDGDVGLHDHLLPFVEAERVPVTIYVATGQIETAQCYWFDRVMNALQSLTPISIELNALGMGRWTINRERGSHNWTAISDLLEALKLVPRETRERAVDAILEQSKSAVPGSFTPLAPLSMAQLQQLAASPWVTIGAHTHCHSLLDRIPLAEAAESIMRSQRLLRAWTGQSVRHFAYPNGNHNAALEKVVADAGFDTATTAAPGLWREDTRRYALPRMPLGRYDTLDHFKLRLIRT